MEDKNSEVIANYEKDDDIVAIGYTKDFYQVKKGNNIGFIEKDLINLEEDSNNVTENNDKLTFGDVFSTVLIVLLLFCAGCFLVLFLYDLFL